MKNELETRDLAFTDLEVREETDGHHLRGLIVPWSSTYDTGTYIEQFSSSAFDKSVTERGDRIPLLEQHDRTRHPVGMSIKDGWVKDASGLIADFLLAPTARGEETRELAAAGMVTGLSVGFRPIRNKTETREGRKHVTRVESYLDHVAVTHQPAYSDAQVIDVRNFDPDNTDLVPKLAYWRHLLK